MLLPRFISCAAARPSASFVCEQFVQQSRCFLQRRAALPIIETQKSPWSVSDMDRRETGLFPGKTKTSLSGWFFFKEIFEPFQLGEAALAWHVLEPQEARQVLEGVPQPCSARG